MVIEQHERRGTRFVQAIQQETPFLATSLHQIRALLARWRCDLFVLTDETFPEENLERLHGGRSPAIADAHQ